MQLVFQRRYQRWPDAHHALHAGGWRVGKLGAVGYRTIVERFRSITRSVTSTSLQATYELPGQGLGGVAGSGTRRLAGERERLLADWAAVRRDQRRGAYQYQCGRPAEPGRRSGAAVGRTDARSLVQYSRASSGRRRSPRATRRVTCWSVHRNAGSTCRSSRTSSCGARDELQLRWEVYNVHQHPEFCAAEQRVGNPSSAAITSTGNSIAPADAVRGQGTCSERRVGVHGPLVRG